MKTIFNLLLFITLVSFKPKNITTQGSPITIEVIFDSYDENNGFYFSYTDENEFEEVITFIKISNELLKKYDLKSDEFTGSEFKITYKTETSDDDDEVLTLLNIYILK